MPDYDATAEARKKEKVLRHGISIKNFWGTPLGVFDALDQEFDFDLDAAAEASTALCPEWLGLDHPVAVYRDALTLPQWPGRRVFLNPPYSPDGGTILRWAVKASTMVTVGFAEHAVLLLPGTPDTEWAEYLAEHADEIRFTPRIRFVDPAGGRTNPMGGSMVVVLRGTRVHALPNKTSSTGYLALTTYGFAPWKEE